MSDYRSRMQRLAPLVLVLAAGLGACRTTPPPAPQTWGERVDATSDAFLVIGDSRRSFRLFEWGAEPSAEERLEFAAALRDERPAFVVHVGDISRTGSDEEEWALFDRDFAPLNEAGVAMFPVLGNHEYRGPDGDALDNYFARFPELGRRTQYYRTFRGVRLLFLDSNVDEVGEPRAARQVDWLERRLAEADEDDSIRAVMVFAHHPPYSNRVRPGESEWVRDDVLPVVARYPKARALFTGHVHSYEHFHAQGVHCIVTGGAGSPLHDLRDADAPTARPDLYRGPRTFHYCRVTVRDRITVEVIMRDGDGGWFVADSFEI